MKILGPGFNPPTQQTVKAITAIQGNALNQHLCLQHPCEQICLNLSLYSFHPNSTTQDSFPYMVPRLLTIEIFEIFQFIFTFSQVILCTLLPGAWCYLSLVIFLEAMKDERFGLKNDQQGPARQLLQGKTVYVLQTRGD